MNWLEFVSSLVWPSVVVGTLVAFRKTIRSWARERPDRIKAGPFEAEWNTLYEQTAQQLGAGSDQGLSGSRDPHDAGPPPFAGAAPPPGSPPPGPPVQGGEPDEVGSAPLSIELRHLARASPLEAIVRAWWRVEEEVLSRVGATTDAVPSYGRIPELLRGLNSEGRVLTETVNALEALSRLRNLAVHNMRPVGTTEALEFLTLADLVLSGLGDRERDAG